MEDQQDPDLKCLLEPCVFTDYKRYLRKLPILIVMLLRKLLMSRFLSSEEEYPDKFLSQNKNNS